jgi:hypothetical protein
MKSTISQREAAVINHYLYALIVIIVFNNKKQATCRVFDADCTSNESHIVGDNSLNSEEIGMA